MGLFLLGAILGLVVGKLMSAFGSEKQTNEMLGQALNKARLDNLLWQNQMMGMRSSGLTNDPFEILNPQQRQGE